MQILYEGAHCPAVAVRYTGPCSEVPGLTRSCATTAWLEVAEDGSEKVESSVKMLHLRKNSRQLGCRRTEFSSLSKFGIYEVN